MRALFDWPCSLLSLRTALVLLAGALLTPAPARAGCGEHVVVVAASEKNALLSVPLVPMAPAKKHVPCSGPHCTRLPLAPVPAPAVPVGPGGQQWACLLEPLRLPANDSAPYLQENPREQPFFVAASIYHPPR